MTASTLPVFPVVIVGAGPTGLTLANLLGRYGTPTLLVEKNASTVHEPRAVSIDDESLRTMQAAGLVDTVLEHVVAGYGSRYLDPRGRCFLKVAPTQVFYGYPRRNAFRQPILERQLREGLERFPHVQTRFGWRLERFSQDQHGVELALAGPAGQTEVVRAGYLVGCDGASSTVRTTLGIPIEGETFSEKWLIVDLEDSPAPCRDTLVFCDVARPCIALPGPNSTRRFEFKLLPGETPEAVLQPAIVEKLLADHGAAAGSRIVRQTVYTFHARLAPTWRVGRVFLAGDACHLTPPFAGQGMNSGIRDAHNLAWKLAAVVAGRLGVQLLDTYEAERKDHVREMIHLALRMGRIMGPPSRLHGALTQLMFRALSLWPAASDYFGQMKYKPKPRFRSGFQIADASRGDAGGGVLLGRLLPQPKVSAAAGDVVLLDELLGEGFALLGITDDPAAFEALTTQPVWRDLGARRIVLTRGQVGELRDVTIVRPAEPLGESPLAPGTDRVLLVRPDRYVAAAFALCDIAHAAERVEALCGPAAPTPRSLGLWPQDVVPAGGES